MFRFTHFSLVGLLSLQMVLLPIEAKAMEKRMSPKQLEGAITKFFDETERLGYQLLDGEGKAIPANEFLGSARTEFTVITPKSSDAGAELKMHVKLIKAKNALKADTVVYDHSGEEVIARRTISLNYVNGDPTNDQIELEQTINSLIRQVENRKVASASVLKKTSGILSQIFGIPSAHADTKSRNQAITCGIFTVMFGALICFSSLVAMSSIASADKRARIVLYTALSIAGILSVVGGAGAIFPRVLEKLLRKTGLDGVLPF